MKKNFLQAYKYLKIVIPVLLLIYIFNKIDFAEILVVLKQTNPWLIALSVALFPLQFIISMLRWKILLKKFDNVDYSLWYLVRIYYEGLFIGYFVPGGLGIDVYRIAKTNKGNRRYLLNFSIIIMEKISGILAAAVCVASLGLFLPISNPIVEKIITISIIIVICFIIGFSIFSIFRSRLFPFIIRNSERFLFQKVKNLYTKVFPEKTINFDFSELLNTFFNLFFSSYFFLFSLSFSIIIFLVSAGIGNITWEAIGLPIPFVINLFGSCLLAIILLLPISFGGIGVREGAYILIFGLFAISSENALLISFIGFTTMIFNNLIGGVLMLINNSRKRQVTISQTN